MILLLSGSEEGGEISARLAKAGYELITIACATQGLGSCNHEAVNVLSNREELAGLLEQKAVRAVLDLSCPLPGRTAKLIKEICERRGIPHLRYMLQKTGAAGSALIYPVYSWTEAAHKAAGLGRTIFLTTGSNNLEIFLGGVKDKTVRVVVRVSPEYSVVKKCRELGLPPRDIVAMQGPFSKEMNRVTFKSYRASVIVTRESGKTGGADTKISAALSLHIPVVMIKRDKSGDCATVWTYDEIVRKLESAR